VHVVAFVNDKAISAGAMIAMACNEIVMVPGSVDRRLRADRGQHRRGSAAAAGGRARENGKPDPGGLPRLRDAESSRHAGGRGDGGDGAIGPLRDKG